MDFYGIETIPKWFSFPAGCGRRLAQEQCTEGASRQQWQRVAAGGENL